MSAENLINFINRSPSNYFVVKNLMNLFKEEKYEQLKLDEEWKVVKGGKYYTTLSDSGLVAFTISEQNEDAGFKIIGAHTDSPGFKIKPCPEIKSSNYMKLNTEVYGGPILNTWLDRPLSISGKVSLRTENPLKPKRRLININRPLLTIPNLAIHMNRKVNEGIQLNKQVDLLPIVALVNEEMEKDNYLVKIIAKELEVEEKDVLDFDLYIYPCEKGCMLGVNNEFISSPRLDDLSMVYSGTQALLKANPKQGINILAAFDNEEIGSRTKQGANSPTLLMILERISLALNYNREEFLRMLQKSFMISADVAHAVHPNKPEKHDPVNHPMLNKGPVIKMSANQSYVTDCMDTAVYAQICEKANVPYQRFVNRSDQAGGSTIGPITAGQIPIRIVDMGAPMLAMHSVRELMGTKDYDYVFKSFREFYDI